MAPANFRTYEGQNRLLTAIIAAHPDLKLNYKGESPSFLPNLAWS